MRVKWYSNSIGLRSGGILENPGLFERLSKYLGAHGEAGVDQPENASVLRQTQASYSSLTRNFVIVLSLASLIASLGLISDSTVVIVGAMLIAPLMKPILASAYGLVISDGRLFFRALLTLCTGIVITIVISASVETVFQLRDATNEIIARVRPSMVDLAIAIAAGIAAAMASVRKNVADTLPGVAIAVALVPPLCVTGIGISLKAWDVALGSFMRFATNLVAIVLCATIVFLIYSHGSIRHAWVGMTVVAGVIVGLIVPLSRTMQQIRYDDHAQEVFENYLHERYPVDGQIHPADLSELDVIVKPDHVFVYAELKSPPGGMTEEHTSKVRELLEEKLGVPINLKVQLLLTEEVMVYPTLPASGANPLYGKDALVPRK